MEDAKIKVCDTHSAVHSKANQMSKCIGSIFNEKSLSIIIGSISLVALDPSKDGIQGHKT